MDLDDAEIEARRLMREHGLSHWQFEWDQSKRYFGRCWHSRYKISLSLPLTAANDRAHVIDCILHEIAHAHVGHDAAHGPIWQAEARRRGAKPVRCFGPEVKVPSLTKIVSFR
jgi:predicted SprT family Zn-dependent metalloprotease